MDERPGKRGGGRRDFKLAVIRPPGSPRGDAKEDERGQVCHGPKSWSKPKRPRAPCCKQQQRHGECNVTEQRVRGEAQHPVRLDELRQAANLECDEAAQDIRSACALIHDRVPRFLIIAPERGYNWSMTLSSALVGALRSFNGMDPMTRCGMLPMMDGSDFLQRVMSAPPNQTPALEAAGSSPSPKEAELSARTKREIIEEAGDSIQNARVDPYVFSPPGMDMS